MNEYLTIYEVARLWGVSYRAVLGLVHQGKLQAFKAGKEWRISKAALLDYESKPVTPDRSHRTANLKIV